MQVARSCQRCVLCDCRLRVLWWTPNVVRPGVCQCPQAVPEELQVSAPSWRADPNDHPGVYRVPCGAREQSGLPPVHPRTCTRRNTILRIWWRVLADWERLSRFLWCCGRRSPACAGQRCDQLHLHAGRRLARCKPARLCSASSTAYGGRLALGWPIHGRRPADEHHPSRLILPSELRSARLHTLVGRTAAGRFGLPLDGN